MKDKSKEMKWTHRDGMPIPEPIRYKKWLSVGERYPWNTVGKKNAKFPKL